MSSHQNHNSWNSLEIAKLLMSLATPVLVVLVGFWINLGLQDFNARVAQETAVVEQRTELWGRMAEPLNDIYAYNVYVGSWQSITPEQLLKHKRTLDKIAYSYRPFFSDDFFDAYIGYINEAFEIGRGWKMDAGIRALKNNRPTDAKRTDLILGVDNRERVHEKYYNLLDIVADELKLKIKRPKPVIRQLD